MKFLCFKSLESNSLLKWFASKIKLAGLLCSVILLFSIYHLNEKSKRVFNRNEIWETNIKAVSVCVQMKSYHCPEGAKESCARLNALYQHLKTEPKITPRTVIEFARRERFSDFFEFVPRFSVVTEHLNANHICFLYQNSTEPEKRTILLKNNAKVSATIFLNDDQVRTSFKGEFYKYRCEDFKECPGHLVGDYKIKFKFLPAPFTTNCRNYANERLPFVSQETRIESRHQCVIECVKQRYRMSRFFYSAKDNESFWFNENEPMTLPDDHELIRSCSAICHGPGCVNVKYIKKNILIDTHTNNRLIIEREQTFFEEIAFPLIPGWTFWLHLFSLLGCLFGVSFVELFSSSIALASGLARLNNHPNLARCVCWTKWTIIVAISAAGSGFLISLLMVNENKVDIVDFPHPNISKYNLFLCFPLGQTMASSPYRNSSLMGAEEYEKFKSFLTSFKLSELNRDLLQSFSFLVGYDAKSVVNQNRTLLFYQDTCMQIEIDFGEKNAVHLNLTTTFYRAYLIDRAPLNTLVPKLLSSVQLSWSFETKIDNCLDYGREYGKGELPDGFSCFSRAECIDKCYLHGFTRRHNRLPFYLLFDEDFERYKDLKFHNIFDSSLRNECTRKFSLPDCKRTIYHRNDGDQNHDQTEHGTVLMIHRPKYNQYLVHQNAYHLNDLAIDFFNFFSTLGLISYGISALKNSRPNGACLKVVYLKTVVKVLCVLLFIFHLCMIFISFDDTYTSAFFAGDPAEKDLPVLNLCIDLEDESVRKHFKMEKPNFGRIKNGNQLEQLTSQIKIGNLIERIEYIDREYRLQNRTLSEIKNETIVVSHFFLGNKKCFSIELKIDPEEIRLELLDYIISFKFHEQLEHLEYELILYHPYSSVHSLQASLDRSKRFAFGHSYEIIPKILYKLNFDFFDSVSFESFEKIKNQFRQATGFSTRLLPLGKEDFECELNDALFASMFPNQTDLSATGAWKISTTTIRFRYSELEDYYNLRMTKDLLIHVKKTEKKKNFNTIFIELLNCLSIWFDLCLLEILDILIDCVRMPFRCFKISNQIGPDN